jgi:hypothetical protein
MKGDFYFKTKVRKTMWHSLSSVKNLNNLKIMAINIFKN